MLCVRLWSDARPAGRVRCWQIQCREPKTGQQKVQLYYEDDPLCLSGYIIYLCGYVYIKVHPSCNVSVISVTLHEEIRLTVNLVSQVKCYIQNILYIPQLYSKVLVYACLSISEAFSVGPPYWKMDIIPS